MKQLSVVLAVICIGAVSMTACAPEPEPTAEELPNVEADVAAIKSTSEQSLAAWNEGDLDGWLAFYTAAVVAMPPNEAVVVGKEAVRKWVLTYFDHFNMEETSSLDEIEVCGDWAFTRGTYNLKAEPKSEGEALQENGKFIYVLERQSDNSWKYSRLIWNRNEPPQL